MSDHAVTSKLILQGDPSGLISTMERAEAQVKRFQGVLDNTSNFVGKFTGAMAAVTAILAGGAMFKATIEETTRWTGEAVKLSRQLGITSEEASILNLAAGDVYLNMDTVSTAALALTKNTMKNKEAFEHYGIALKDNNGHQRSTLDIMQDVNEEILSHAEGREREIVGLQLYGKSWDQVRNIVRLTGDTVEEAKRKAEELHLIVGDEAIAKSKAYKAAMNDVEDILMSFKIQVGDQVIPVLTKLAMWFNDTGPTTSAIFGGALKGVATFAAGAGLALMVLYDAAYASVKQVFITVSTIGSVIDRVMAGDLKGAVAVGKAGIAEFNQVGVDFVDSMTKRWNQFYGFLDSLFTDKPIKQRKLYDPEDDKKGTAPYEKEVADQRSKLLGLEDAKLTATLQGYQQRAQAIKSGNSVLMAEEEFYLRTGLMGQEEYNEKKYELERQTLINTKGLLDEEIREIEAAKERKLGLTSDETERAKIIQKARQESAAKLAEKQRLSGDLYMLDLKYFTDTTVLEETRQNDMNAIQAKWKQKRDADAAKDKDLTRQFFAEVDAMSGNGMDAALLRIDQEREAWIRSWADQVQSVEERDKRIALIEDLSAKKRIELQRKEAMTKVSLTAGMLGAMAGLSDAAFGLSQSKNKTQFRIFQQLKVGENEINTAGAITRALNDSDSSSWYERAAKAIIAGAIGTANTIRIMNATPDGGASSGGLSIPDVSGSPPASAAGVTQPASVTTAKQSDPIVNVHIYGVADGNYTDWDGLARNKIIPSVRTAMADGSGH